MNPTIATTSTTPNTIALENARFMSRVYSWMTGGILTTAAVASYLGQSEEMALTIVRTPILMWTLIIAQFAAVIFLSAGIKRMSALTATITYFGYAAISGATLSVIFLIYTSQSIGDVFLVTACGFAGLSAFGYFTKRDLGPVGSFCTMGLFGLIGFSLLSLFLPSMRTENVLWWRSIAGLVIFAGLTAYDTQRIKAVNIIGNEGTEEDTKEAIFGALTLYLDFVNLFLNLLRIMGRRK